MAVQYVIAAGSAMAMQRLKYRLQGRQLLLRYAPGAAIVAVAMAFLATAAGA